MPSVSLHGRTALIALLAVGMFAVYSVFHDDSAPSYTVADIGIEHEEPVAVLLTVAVRGNIRIIEIAHNAKSAIKISVPDSWKRSEVRGVPLASVTTDTSALGYTRWALPPTGAVTFKTSVPFDAINVHNPSAIPLTARLTSVNLDTDTTHTDARLLQATVTTLPLTDSTDE